MEVVVDGSEKRDAIIIAEVGLSGEMMPRNYIYNPQVFVKT